MIFSLLFISIRINAQDILFGWNLGNINIYYDFVNRDGFTDLEILHFNWLINGFSIGFNVFDFKNIGINKNRTYSEQQYLILPLEVAYVPLNIDDWLFFSVYCRIGWQLTQYTDYFHNEFYGSMGIKLFIFPEIIFGYSPYISLFTEFDTNKKFKIGLGIDLSAVIYVILKSDLDRRNIA